MQEKLVSIIVPIYKVEQYLEECVQSLLNQTYKNLEVILVDDGSPDNCGKLCDEYAKKDGRIKVIHKENGGLSSARNAGLDIAKGEYIAFVDSDDCVSNKFIETLYRLCEDNDADIAVSEYIKFSDKVDVDTEIKEKNIKKYDSVTMQKLIYSNECVKFVVVWNKLYKRRIYEDLRFPIGKINEDEFTTYKAYDKTNKDVVATNEVLYYYRYNENSIMGKKFNEKRLDVLDAYEERKKYYLEKKDVILFEKTVYEYQGLLKRFYILAFENIKGSSKVFKSIREKMRKNYKEYMKLGMVNKKEAVIMKFFISFPRVYCYLKNIIGGKKNEQ